MESQRAACTFFKQKIVDILSGISFASKPHNGSCVQPDITNCLFSVLVDSRSFTVEPVVQENSDFLALY